MKHKCKALGIFALVCFLTYLYGCQKEEFEIEQPKAANGTSFQVEVPAFESYYVPEDLKGKLVDRLFKALGYVTRTGGNVTESYETGIGTILTDEILAVEDDFGTKYTFKLDHPEKDFYTFFNLVMVDRGDDVVVLLKKYIMTEEFAILYRSNQKSVDDFSGSVATTRLTNPCLCEFPEDGEPVPVYPGDYTSGGSGGTVSGDGPSGSDGPSGGNDGGGPIITYCFLISFTIETVRERPDGSSHVKIKRYTLNTCTGEIIQHNKAAKKSKQGNNQTETYNENDCCNEGVVGILDGSNQNSDPCKELKKISSNSAIYDPVITHLRTKSMGDKEHAWVYKKFPFPSQNFAPPTAAGHYTTNPNRVNLNAFIGPEWLGAFHNHTNPGLTKSINMFSPEDVMWLLQKGKAVDSYNQQNQAATNFSELFLGLVVQNNTYVIKIKDWTQFSSSLNNQDDVKDFYETLKKLYIDLGSEANQVSLQKTFLKTLKKFNMGIGLFEQDSTGKWDELNLDPSNNNNPPIKVPCN